MPTPTTFSALARQVTDPTIANAPRSVRQDAWLHLKECRGQHIGRTQIDRLVDLSNRIEGTAPFAYVISDDDPDPTPPAAAAPNPVDGFRVAAIPRIREAIGARFGGAA